MPQPALPPPRRQHPLDVAKVTLDRWLYRLGIRKLRFRGAFASYAEAVAAVRPGRLAGYDHDAVADVTFASMCEIQLWDWPVLYWLRRVWPTTGSVLDVGGHQGTKFRAFRNHLELGGAVGWVVYDVPAIVRAGRARCGREGLTGLSFVDTPADAPAADVLLASGVLQYLDVPFDDLLRRLPALPRHLILNKVATRPGPTVVTLENFGVSDVPYQIRNHDEFVGSVEALGYEIVDGWRIPELSHVIPTHPKLGRSTSSGFYARLREGHSP